MSESPSALVLVAEISIRSGDIDRLGHVNQARYHEFLEQGRFLMFGALGEAMPEFVLARVELDHVAETRAGTRYVEVYMRVAEVGRSSVRFEHEIRTPDGEVVARGVSVMVAWDQAQRRKRAIDEHERAALLELGSDRATDLPA
jgi:acyl-CoA thioesterase FadM